ncbi:MAG: DUF1330 domain-containing protein [Candidatus Eiseniibacteriota bacterium]|nr:MAG: DUF1330 domain-containing protein [Candidatus Eisenbacteria bacterium]
MSSYFIALIDIHNPEQYKDYLAGFDEVFKKYKGQVVCVEENPRVLEGDWPAGRTVLIRFPNDEKLLRWYESPEYQALARHRKEASVCRVAVISGRD